MEYKMTDAEREFAEKKGYSEKEYWFRRAQDAEAEVELLEELLEAAEEELQK